MQEIDWLRSADNETTPPADIIPPPPQFTDWIVHTCSHADDSLIAIPPSCGNEGASACCCRCADVYECVSRLEDVSLSGDQYGLIDEDDSSSTDSRGVSGSDCGLEQESDSICTHERESDSSCCVGDGCDSVCCLEDPLGCLSDSFQDGTGVSDTTYDLMGVSGFTPSLCHAELDFESTSSWQGGSQSSSSFAGASGCTQGISDCTCTHNAVSTCLCTDSAEGVSDIDTVLDGLRGRVTRMPKHFVLPLFKDLVKHTPNEWMTKINVNEGIIFHSVRYLHSVQLH